ncbi:MAG: nucleotide exchange factor GrpE [Candidatus Omnitrophota bacterium]|nr:nucleotide exchange factor GrpE [Candidatus Omnitrophota bacterium]
MDKKQEAAKDADKKNAEPKAAKTITIDKAEYEKLKESVKSAEGFQDKYLRAHAELDNARKRLIKEKEEYTRFANEDLLSDILYIVDNFDRAITHMNAAQKIESILDGINMILKQFHAFLERNGLKKIESIGKKFNPQIHEAIEHVEIPDEKKAGVVIEEIQTGYMLNDRLLRPAVVKVGKKGGELHD